MDFSLGRNGRSKRKQGNYKNLKKIHSDTGDVCTPWSDGSEEEGIKLFQKP